MVGDPLHSDLIYDIPFRIYRERTFTPRIDPLVVNPYDTSSSRNEPILTVVLGSFSDPTHNKNQFFLWNNKQRGVCTGARIPGKMSVVPMHR